MEKRIQKILSEMGIASRREAEEMILEGRITVNGRIAELGMKADPNRDHIKVDRKLLTKREPKVYLMFNKPRNVVTTLKDPEGRPTVKDFLEDIRYRVYPVGRLDYDSEGLLLLTNDGDFANAIMHPSKKITKTYQVKVKGIPEQKEIDRLKKGIHLEDGLTAPATVKRLKTTENNSWLEVTIYEGRKRQLRRMFDQIGHSVLKLKRIRIKGVDIGDLKPGRYRYLTPDEVTRIKKEISKLGKE